MTSLPPELLWKILVVHAEAHRCHPVATVCRQWWQLLRGVPPSGAWGHLCSPLQQLPIEVFDGILWYSLPYSLQVCRHWTERIDLRLPKFSTDVIYPGIDIMIHRFSTAIVTLLDILAQKYNEEQFAFFIDHDCPYTLIFPKASVVYDDQEEWIHWYHQAKVIVQDYKHEAPIHPSIDKINISLNESCAQEQSLNDHDIIIFYTYDANPFLQRPFDMWVAYDTFHEKLYRL